MAMLPACLFHAGMAAVLWGGICLIKPLQFLGLRTRRRAGLLFAFGLMLAGIGFAFPTGETRIVSPRTHLDYFVPVYQFNEFHSTRIAAPRDRVYAALKSVSADDIFLFRTLTWIRRFGWPGRESILNAPAQRPILDVALRSGFLLLAEEPGREIVFGTAVVAPPGFHPKREPTPEDFRAVQRPGFALAAMNLRIEDAGTGECLVTTETRIFATDARARRRFARYWRVIYPGSALLRRSWLLAVKRRAEGRNRSD
jgi:hypothetical protein